MTGSAPVRDAGPRETAPPAQEIHGRLAEVWGDIVDLGDLARAIVIGAVVSLAFYSVAGRLFAPFAAPETARSFAMLAGLVGCVCAGAVCARLFRPKRIMTEEAGAAAPGSLGPDGADGWDDADLPAGVRAEMRELGLGGGPPDRG